MRRRRAVAGLTSMAVVGCWVIALPYLSLSLPSVAQPFVVWERVC